MSPARWHPKTRRLASGAVASWKLGTVIGSNGVPLADSSIPPSGQSLRQAFEALIGTFNERHIRYAIIGGIAILQHTRVRTTDDIDALMTVPQIAMPGLFEALQGRGFTVDILKNIRELRDDGFTSIRFADVMVDLMQPVLPLYAHVLDRAFDTQILGQSVRVSSAEGLIVMKLVAMRPQDEVDIQDLLAAYAGGLDLDYIRAELDTFTELNDPRRGKFESWVRRQH